MLRPATRRLLARATTTTILTFSTDLSAKPVTNSASVESWKRKLRQPNPSSLTSDLTFNLALPYSNKEVLGRKYYIDKFWVVVNEMKQIGYEMDMNTYVNLTQHLCEKGMIEDAVNLYEFIMDTTTTIPGFEHSLFLMQQILIAKDLNMQLFRRVLIVFTETGQVLTDSILDEFFKTLNSVNRLDECDKVLHAMKYAEFHLTQPGYDRLVSVFAESGKTFEAKIIQFEMCPRGYHAQYSTYKLLIHKLLAQQNMRQAKIFHGYMMTWFPPFVDPFINHISKYGTDSDAFDFLTEMNLLRLPCISLCIRMLDEAFVKVGRHREAYNCISKLPDRMRNHAEVLHLLHRMKTNEAAVATTLST